MAITRPTGVGQGMDRACAMRRGCLDREGDGTQGLPELLGGDHEHTVAAISQEDTSMSPYPKEHA